MCHSVLLRFGLLLPALLTLAACGDGPPAEPTPPATSQETSAPAPRTQDLARIMEGEQLYQQHCARCHGAQAEGTSDWRKPGPDGKFPPPPLNGTAHTWHHPLQALRRTIRQGGPPGMSSMPAFGDKLTDQQIDAIIAWIQSRWSDQVYQKWYEINRQASSR